MATLRLPYHGIILKLSSSKAEAASRGMEVVLLASELLTEENRKKVDPLSVALRTVECCICAHAAAGIDITTSNYLAGIDALVDDIHKQYGR